MKKLGIIVALGTMGLFGGQAATAGLLDSAQNLWQFDFADSGSPVTAAQITDSSGNPNQDADSVVSGSLLNWTTVPATGPGGTPAVGPDQRGLQFNPVVNTAGAPDNVTSPGFIANGDAINGQSSTVASRFFWEGYASDDSDAQMFWLINNSLSGGGPGYLFGVRGGKLSLHMTNTGGSFDSTLLTLTPGSWYDVAAVFDDLGDGVGANDEITLYLYKNGQLLSHMITHAVPSAGGSTNIIVGGESLGAGSSNQRKGFKGTVDYIAFWDTALTEADITTLVIPEPASISVIALLGGAAMMRRRIQR
jgi:hypothetical protein